MTTQSGKHVSRTAGKRLKAKLPEKGQQNADKPSKLEQIVSMLVRADGASLADLMKVTRWQAHSVRGALAGALKKKGHVVLSERIDGVRRYRIEIAQ